MKNLIPTTVLVAMFVVLAVFVGTACCQNTDVEKKNKEDEQKAFIKARIDDCFKLAPSNVEYVVYDERIGCGWIARRTREN